MTEGIALTDKERAALIPWILYEHLKDLENWLRWEDIPELGEYEFDRLVADAAIEADVIAARARWTDKASGIDGYAILQRLQP